MNDIDGSHYDFTYRNCRSVQPLLIGAVAFQDRWISWQTSSNEKKIKINTVGGYSIDSAEQVEAYLRELRERSGMSDTDHEGSLRITFGNCAVVVRITIQRNVNDGSELVTLFFESNNEACKKARMATDRLSKSHYPDEEPLPWKEIEDVEQ